MVTTRRCHLPHSSRNNTDSSYTQSFPAAASLASVINIGRQDITPLDYFYWGHLKQQVYDIKPNAAPELKDELPTINFHENFTLQESDEECNWRADVCIWPHGVVIWLIWYHVKCLKSTFQKHVLIFTGCPVITAEHFTWLYYRSTQTIFIMYWIIISSLVFRLSVCMLYLNITKSTNLCKNNIFFKIIPRSVTKWRPFKIVNP